MSATSDLTTAYLERLAGPIELVMHLGPHTAVELDQAAVDGRPMVTYCGRALVPIRLAWLDPTPDYTVCPDCARERGRR